MERGLTRFRCHTEHAFTAEVLLSELRRQGEAKLWNAAHVMDEQVMVLDHLSQRGQPDEEGAARREEARVIRERGEVLRQFTQHAPPEERSPRSGG